MTETRRGLLRAAAAGGAAALGLEIAAQSAVAATPALLQGARSDPQVLLRLLEFEHVAEFAYGHVAQVAPLPAVARNRVLHFLGQERSHAQLLAGELAKRHVAAPAPPSGVAAADRNLSALGVTGRLNAVHDEQAAIHLLIAIETVAEDLYYGAVERLANVALIELAGEILACEAQHWSALSALLHHGRPKFATPHSFAPVPAALKP